ncbi:MAG: CHASE domain-containing protein [Planctomycetes bacterium]|nr:CHASE domain-containing protein [Planctomycetota bacterium]
MPRKHQFLRLLVEIVAILLLAELAMLFALPLIAHDASQFERVLLDGALLVLVSTPLIYWRVKRSAKALAAAVAFERPAGKGAILAATLSALVIGLGVTTLAVLGAVERTRLEARSQFDRLVDRLSTETERRVNLPMYGLKGARGVYAASQSVTRLEFRAYATSRDIVRELPGVLGLGFLQRVPRAELAEFVERERADEAPDFEVRTSGDERDLFVSKFLDPLERNRLAWGLDLGADPVRRAAIESAIRSGEPTLTPRIELVQDARKRPGFLFLLPVYRNGTHPTTPSERESCLDGLLFAPVVLEDLLAGSDEAAEGKLDLEILEHSPGEDPRLIYDWDGEFVAGSTDGDSPDYAGRMFHELRALKLGGRTWTLAFSTTPKFDQQVASGTPALIGLAGGLLSALLAYVIFSMGLARARALGLASEMTADLAKATHEAQDALRDFHALRTTLDEHSIVSVADARGRILDVNKAFCRISGYTREELIGQDHRLINSGHHPRSFWIAAWRSFSAGRPWRAEVCNRAKNGAVYWVDTVIAPFVGADGRIERYFSIRTDVTARKQAEAEQAAALALATALARSSDARQAARAVNDALGETTGLSRSAVLLFDDDALCRFVGWRGLSMEFRRAVEGHCPWKRGEPDAVPMVVNDVASDPSLSIYRELFRQEGIASLAYVPVATEKGVIGMLMLYASKLGTMTPARVQAARSAAASLGSAVARLRMAEALATNERRFRSLVEGTDVIVWEFDALLDVFSYVSPQAARLGYPLSAWLAPGFWNAHLHPEDREQAVDFASRETDAGRNHRFQYRMLAADGRVVWIDDFVSLEKGVGGELLLRGVLVDITESKQVSKELEEARVRAEAATRAKSEFLANMSHEIRTPLTAILGYSELLREEREQHGATDRHVEAVDTICSAGNYLLTVINDVLDLSKIEAGKMTVELVETSVIKILGEVADLMRPRAGPKGLELRVVLDSPVHERTLGDPTRLRQILMNLAGNAVKFTESGSVTLRAREELREEGARLVLDVEDTGPGLAPELSNQLFLAFSQADASVTRKHGGTGLGLTICRRLAGLMGGTVTLARTAPGQGSCFRVDLPLVPAPGAVLVASIEPGKRRSEPRPALPAARLQGRVLVAEDGRDNQLLVSLHLRRAGAEVVIADNGRIALEKLEQARIAGQPFDLLLTDMQMPELDGYSLARTLREGGSTLAIIALTAHAMAEDRQRCLEAGCDDYTTKPIDRAALLAACTRWIGQPGGTASERRPG